MRKTNIVLSLALMVCSATQGANADDKVYSVREVAEMLKGPPEWIQNKKIKLKAYMGGQLKGGSGCEHYCTLIDERDRPTYEGGGWDRVPSIKTAPCMSISQERNDVPLSVYPFVNGVYLGHFYDAGLEKFCPGSGHRFMIDKTLVEIIPPALFLETTVPSRGMILDGLGIQSPVHVVLRDNKVFVNGVMIYPRAYEKDRGLNARTDEERKMEYDSIVRELKNGWLPILLENLSMAQQDLPPNVLMNVNEIIKSAKPEVQKRAALVQLLKLERSYSASRDEVLLSILKNWKMVANH